MLAVQEWAEIRAMWSVEGLSIKEIARRTGHSRNTIRAALRCPEPPRYGPRPARPSKLDPFKAQIHALLADDGRVPSQVIRDRITELGYGGGKTICDDYVRELRPVFSPPRTFQRTHYEPAELVQFDLWEPSAPIPVGHAQLRRALGGHLLLGLFAGRCWGACLLQGGVRRAVGDELLPRSAGGAAAQGGLGP